MNFKELTPGWFDVVALIVLIFGLVIGRKRGMSNELLDVLQWLMMVVLGAMFYEPLAQLMMKVIPISLFLAQLVAYLGIIIGIKVGITLLKRAVGEKLVGSDLFGRMEYHFGAMAGLLRFACMLVVALSVLYARAFSLEKVEADLKAQEKEYGSAFFPTYGQIQRDVFYRSLVGQAIREHMKDQLINPESYVAKVGRAGVAAEREKAVEDVMNPKAPKKKAN
jgi:uncharacterized membrane protein required for colicin V production